MKRMRGTSCPGILKTRSESSAGGESDTHTHREKPGRKEGRERERGRETSNRLVSLAQLVKIAYE